MTKDAQNRPLDPARPRFLVLSSPTHLFSINDSQKRGVGVKSKVYQEVYTKMDHNGPNGERKSKKKIREIRVHLR